jgi:REP element-mobilizing transposase RayT
MQGTFILIKRHLEQTTINTLNKFNLLNRSLAVEPMKNMPGSSPKNDLKPSSFGFAIRKHMVGDLQSPNPLFRICNPKAHGRGFAIPLFRICNPKVPALSDLQSESTWLGICNPLIILFVFCNMGLKNKIEIGQTYFLTLTVVDWVDVFTRPVYKNIITDSLAFCIKEKGLQIYAWVLMSNHLHLVASAAGDIDLSDILRDMKKFTSKKIVETIHAVPESRRDWMLYRFEYAGKYDKKIKNYQFWQEGNEPKEIQTFPFLEQKINYIHNNPVRAELVSEPHHYLHSSAIDYSCGKGILPVILVW